MAAIDVATGVASTWNPNADWAVTALTKIGPTIYLGGPFTFVGGLYRQYAAAVDSATTAPLPWDP